MNLTCSNLPAGVTCSFSNASVSLVPGTAQTVTLTLNASSSAAATTTAKNKAIPSPLDSGVPARLAFAGILGFALLGLGRRRRYFPSRWLTVLLLFGRIDGGDRDHRLQWRQCWHRWRRRRWRWNGGDADRDGDRNVGNHGGVDHGCGDRNLARRPAAASAECRRRHERAER